MWKILTVLSIFEVSLLQVKENDRWRELIAICTFCIAPWADSLKRSRMVNSLVRRWIGQSSWKLLRKPKPRWVSKRVYHWVHQVIFDTKLEMTQKLYYLKFLFYIVLNSLTTYFYPNYKQIRILTKNTSFGWRVAIRRMLSHHLVHHLTRSTLIVMVTFQPCITRPLIKKNFNHYLANHVLIKVYDSQAFYLNVDFSEKVCV